MFPLTLTDSWLDNHPIIPDFFCFVFLGELIKWKLKKCNSGWVEAISHHLFSICGKWKKKWQKKKKHKRTLLVRFKQQGLIACLITELRVASIHQVDIFIIFTSIRKFQALENPSLKLSLRAFCWTTNLPAQWFDWAKTSLYSNKQQNKSPLWLHCIKFAGSNKIKNKNQSGISRFIGTWIPEAQPWNLVAGGHL